jgi:hypothetical protein
MAQGGRNMTIQKFFAATTEQVGERQVRVICSTGDVDRAGDIVVQDGIDLSAYRTNPIVLWGHDTNQPIARASEIGVVDGKLMATGGFPAGSASAPRPMKSAAWSRPASSARCRSASPHRDRAARQVESEEGPAALRQERSRGIFVSSACRRTRMR